MIWEQLGNFGQESCTFHSPGLLGLWNASPWSPCGHWHRWQRRFLPQEDLQNRTRTGEQPCPQQRLQWGHHLPTSPRERGLGTASPTEVPAQGLPGFCFTWRRLGGTWAGGRGIPVLIFCKRTAAERRVQQTREPGQGWSVTAAATDLWV